MDDISSTITSWAEQRNLEKKQRGLYMTFTLPAHDGIERSLGFARVAEGYDVYASATDNQMRQGKSGSEQRLYSESNRVSPADLESTLNSFYKKLETITAADLNYKPRTARS